MAKAKRGDGVVMVSKSTYTSEHAKLEAVAHMQALIRDRQEAWLARGNSRFSETYEMLESIIKQMQDYRRILNERIAEEIGG